MKTICLGCSQIVEPWRNGRCRECWRGVERKRSRTRQQPHLHNSAWRKLSRETISRHIARYGLVCPGYGVQQHGVSQRSDLTTDHVKARSLDAGVQVLCRSCNARKGNR
jgi:hypothetical protein